MSPELVRELEEEMRAYGLKRGETEEERERNRRTVKLMLLMAPEVGEELTADGRREGLRAAVEDLCEVLGIALSDERRAHLAALDLPGLESLRAHLKTHKDWPRP